jgi:pyruvyltransferase
MKNIILVALIVLLRCPTNSYAYEMEGLPLCYWKKKDAENFGDYLSLKLVERIVGGKVVVARHEKNIHQQRLLAIGSVLALAKNGDIVWGTGMKVIDSQHYNFDHLDIRAVRGPLTRDFLERNFGIYCPEIYGDPALLVPYFFPEFKKKEEPKYDYVIVPHYADEYLFPKSLYPNVIYPTEPYTAVIRKILDSKFVISSSLHGVVIAEAYGIPARYVRVSDHEPLFKYEDYYLGTNRPNFTYATSIKEALEMGGEPPFECDLEKLYNSFPFEYWPNANFKKLTSNCQCK